MTQDEFKNICILSGTDYNIHANGDNSKVNLSYTIKQFRKFKSIESSDTFYNWLQNNTEYISDIELLQKINKMFNLKENHESLNAFKEIKIINGPVRQDEIESIMAEEDFIFCK
jgi:hypothetical protein